MAVDKPAMTFTMLVSVNAELRWLGDYGRLSYLAGG
jgi:hypothetical protein